MFVTASKSAPGVVVVTLSRPERMNALSMDVARELLTTLDRIAKERDTAVVILTGEGRGFCAGGDVKEMALNRNKTQEQRHADLALMHQIPRRIAQMPQVVIAAVNGAAYGAGLAVALTCDLVMAGRSARFGTAFLKQGLVSDFGLSYQLTRLAGPAVARQVILTDRVLCADEAKTLGLVGEVHDDPALMGRAGHLADKIAAWPGDARSGMKHLLRRAETADHETMLGLEADMQGQLILSAAHEQAVDQFNAGPSTPPVDPSP